MQVDFKFEIGQTVLIKANGLEGEVRGIARHANSVEERVQVAYTDDTKRVTEYWFDADQIEAKFQPEAEEATE